MSKVILLVSQLILCFALLVSSFRMNGYFRQGQRLRANIHIQAHQELGALVQETVSVPVKFTPRLSDYSLNYEPVSNPFL